MKVIGWRFWFVNGQTFHGRTGPGKLPADGGLAVVQYYEGGYRDLMTGDWWGWNGERWDPVRSPDRGGVWAERPDAKVVVQGIEIEDREFELVQRVMWEAKCP